MDGPRRRFSTFSISSSMEVCISLLISFYYYCHGLILCIIIIIEFNSCFTVRSLIFVFRREIQKLKPEVFVFFRSFVLLILCFVLNLFTQ